MRSEAGPAGTPEQIERAFTLAYGRDAPRRRSERRRRATAFFDKQSDTDRQACDGRSALVDLCQMLLASNEFLMSN